MMHTACLEASIEGMIHTDRGTNCAQAAVGKEGSGLGCFPATPPTPATFFDERLLLWIRALQRHSPLSTSAWTAVVNHMHARNGFAAAKPAVWANIGNALAEWRLLQDLVWSDTSLDIQTPIPGVILCSVVAVTCNLVLRSLLLRFLACWEPYWECC